MIARAEHRSTLFPPIMVVTAFVGSALLALRPLVAGDPHRTALMATGFAGLVAVSMAVPSPRGAPSLHPLAVLVVGVGAMVAGAFVAGRPPPYPHAVSGLVLGAFAAVAEEAFFRRFLFGALSRIGVATAVLGSALLFALVHIPVYGVVVFPVDLGAGLVLSWQRWASGSWASPAATHVVANLLAVMR